MKTKNNIMMMNGTKYIKKDLKISKNAKKKDQK